MLPPTDDQDVRSFEPPPWRPPDGQPFVDDDEPFLMNPPTTTATWCSTTFPGMQDDGEGDDDPDPDSSIYDDETPQERRERREWDG